MSEAPKGSDTISFWCHFCFSRANLQKDKVSRKEVFLVFLYFLFLENVLIQKKKYHHFKVICLKLPQESTHFHFGVTFASRQPAKR